MRTESRSITSTLSPHPASCSAIVAAEGAASRSRTWPSSSVATTCDLEGAGETCPDVRAELDKALLAPGRQRTEPARQLRITRSPKNEKHSSRKAAIRLKWLWTHIPLGRSAITCAADWRTAIRRIGVGTDHDTAAFAVSAIRRWWDGGGRAAYPQARRLLITADAGGSNGYRTRAWKAELAALALNTGLQVTVCHFPPGTSKWNKVEHRLFSHITMNWAGRPLTSHEVILSVDRRRWVHPGNG
ncbi:MAG: hypothetical protein QG671_1298 [Actinomycetota bacterium]|nr:hypothetical protein [Actinomycetota bacterium]